MNIRQQIIKDRIDETAKILGLPDKDLAFLRLAHSLITGQSLHVFDTSDLVDGTGDKQIDSITIDEGDGEATIFVIQAKNSEAFSSNSLIQMRNGLNWLFRKSKADLAKLKNVALRDKIQ